MSDSPKPKLIRVALVVIATSLVWALGVYAQDNGRVLHEYFNPWDLGDGLEASSAEGADSRPSGTGEAPSARASEAGQPPPLSVNPSSDEMVFGANGPVDPGSTGTPYGPLNPGQQETTLDDDTDRVDRLNYFANFEPSIMPYKRGVVQNAIRVVDGEYKVRLVSARDSAVRIGGTASSDMDTFWGTFALRTQPGRKHPLPSVAADQEILEVQSEPDAAIDIRRDEADNYYLRTRHEGLLRLNIKFGAPRFYFDGRPRTDVEWSEFDEDLTPPIPGDAQSAARRVLSTVDVSRAMEPHDALEALVAWYRDFEARPFPDEMRGRDLFESVSEAQIGVCRHRSLAFMVAARSLGIPTRYIYNEAHAFVEVHWPGQGWRRIDLGGAANDFNFSSRSGSSMHDASYNDNFPQPPNYVEELQRQADMQDDSQSESSSEDSNQASAEQQEGSNDGRDGAQPPVDEQNVPAGQGDDPQNANPAEGAEATQGEPVEPDGPMQMAEPVEQDSRDAEAQPDPQESREQVSLEITSASREAFRGRAIDLKGRLRTASGRALSGQPVEVVLGPVGSNATTDVISLGTTRTDGAGRFEGRFSIPRDVSIGRWSVMVRYRGSSEYRSASAE
ncbi:MAG: transglutaminase domain-containing protein [Myxococcota bacterium]